MESLVFLALSPLAALLMGVVAVVAWQRRDAAGGWALAAFSAASAGWLVSDALGLVASTPQTAAAFAAWTNVWAPLPGLAWLAFLLRYTGRTTRAGRVGLAALTAWSLVFGALALTNGAHGLVWASVDVSRDGPFLSVSTTLGPLGWAQSVLMWGAVAASLAVLVRTYAGESARDLALSWWIVVGALVPLVVNVGHAAGFGPVEKDFTPLAMAASSGAFALGLVRYRLLDLRPIARAALVDGLREGVLVLDPQGRVVDANPALRRALGDGAVRIGRPLAETAPALARAIAVTPDETFRLGDGPATRYVELRISPLANDDGAPAGRLVLLHDVTRRREERAALHRANAELYDANAELQARNDELDAFAHTVAHDLKNSIQGVLGWAQVLVQEGPGMPPDEHRDVAGQVVRSAGKMGAVVHELLLLAGVRQAEVEPRPVEMGRVVEEALARVRAAHPGLEARSPDRWPVAVGHAPWVEEVWVNYLSNAAKYGGPTVTLGADVTAAGRARFWVHDDGPGLDVEAQGQLFVAFSRVGGLEVEGHGLGLSIVRRIAERLGGTCGVESAPGAGTRFWFALPTPAPVGVPGGLEALPA